MLARAVVGLLLVASAASEPSLWLDTPEDDVQRGSGNDERQLSCPFDGKIGPNTIASTLFVSPSGIITGEEIDGSSSLKDGDEAALNDLSTWFIAPLYASYKRDNVEMACWKVLEPTSVADVLRNMASDFEPSQTVAITFTNMAFTDDGNPIDMQVIVSSDDSGNAFAILSYKTDPGSWQTSVKKVAVKLPGSVVTEYASKTDLSNLFGTSNYDSAGCCTFLMRLGDGAADLAKPTLPGSCDQCGEGEQCMDDKEKLQQRCMALGGGSEDPAASEEACGALQTCNANAACTDQCCVCNSDYWGNGAHCFPSSTSQTELTPSVEVRIWSDGDWVQLGTGGSTIGLTSQIYKANVDARFWNYAPLALAVVPWLFSDTQSTLQYNPIALTGGNFNRSLDVQMVRADESPVSFRLTSTIAADIANNAINVDLKPEVDGELSVPEFASLRRLVLKYQHKQQGSISAAGRAEVVDASDVVYTYTWTETITFFECGRTDHVASTDKSVQVRLDGVSWSEDTLQFAPTIEVVDGGIEIGEVSTQVRGECGDVCTGGRECRMNPDSSQYECLCAEGYTDNGDSYAQCEPKPDVCGGVCTADTNTVCNAETTTCVCREGYEAIEGTDPLSCQVIPTETCTQTCHEKANCTQVDGAWQCVCQGDFIGNGTFCEPACTSRPDFCSRTNERCSPTSKRCECKSGFKLLKDKRGAFCVSAQSCAHAKCSAAGTQCVRRDDFNYECICKRDMYYDVSSSSCVANTPSTNTSGDWIVYAHGVVLARGRPDNRGNIVPWPMLVISDQRAVAVATDCSTGAVYWSDVKNKVIRRAYLNKNRVVPEVIVALSKSSSVEGMAFDHVAKNLYYTDAGTDSIVVFNVMTNKTKTIATGCSDPRGITLDLVNNKVYWVDWDPTNPRVERANLDGSGKAVVVSNTPTNQVKYPNGIVVDGFKQLLYWADAGTGQVQKINTATLDQQSATFSLENFDRTWEEQRYMLFDITLARNSDLYATVWGLNKVMRTKDQKVFDRAPGGNGKIFGLDYYRSTCPLTSSKCAMGQGDDGWKADQCDKTSQLCFTLAHADNPSCVCADDSSDC